jgi:hypothetical protein
VGGGEWGGSTAWPVSMVSNTEGGRGGGWGVRNGGPLLGLFLW